MEYQEFMNALAADLPAAERLITCGFVGDPNAVGPSAWRPRPWAPDRELIFGPAANAYVTVASFGRAADGTYRRRNECFASGRAFMVDDVGTKVSPETVKHVPPSAIVETSPNNFQWWYFLSMPVLDAGRFDGLIRAFIAKKLLGDDPGMSGVTRVGRIPGFINGKAKYNGWRCKLTELNGRRYTSAELEKAFALEIIGRRDFGERKRLLVEEALARNDAFAAIYTWLDRHKMLKRDRPDMSGWTEMTCPWVDNHTGGADTGAAIREPAPDNQWYGAFRCHHGHCGDKGWGDLTDWVAEQAAEQLEMSQAHGDEQMMALLAQENK